MSWHLLSRQCSFGKIMLMLSKNHFFPSKKQRKQMIYKHFNKLFQPEIPIRLIQKSL